MPNEEKGVQYPKITYRDAFEMLPMNRPVTLSIEQQASLRILLNAMDSIATDLAFREEATRMTYGPP